MKKLLLFLCLITMLSFCAKAQADEESRKKGKNDQDALDKSMTPKKTKEELKYEKAIKKQKKKKAQMDNATRKQTSKVSKSRLSSASRKTRQKKKNYVKSHK